VGSSSGQPADCPNWVYVAGFTVANVKWQLSGDPLQGATVGFDGDRGIFVVRGTYSMSADYDYHDLFTGGHGRGTLGGAYEALAVLDSGQLHLINIASK
jgi:hypothetical protein